MLYVPGFNTPFEAPLLMMAQFAHFMGRDGVFIAYSWPSTSSFLGYHKQKASAAISVRNIRQLLLLLGEETDAEQIHIVSYSAGAPLVTEALLQLRLIHAGSTRQELRADVPIGHVVYAGADEDFEYFRNLFLDQFDDVAETIQVYTSSNDRGLLLSRAFTTGNPRLGRSLKALTDADRQALREATVVSFIDVTAATKAAGGGDLFAHGYWYMNPWVNQDVISVLQYDLAPESRGLTWDEREATWSFPRDYPGRIVRIID